MNIPKLNVWGNEGKFSSDLFSYGYVSGDTPREPHLNYLYNLLTKAHNETASVALSVEDARLIERGVVVKMEDVTVTSSSPNISAVYDKATQSIKVSTASSVGVVTVRVPTLAPNTSGDLVLTSLRGQVIISGKIVTEDRDIPNAIKVLSQRIPTTEAYKPVLDDSTILKGVPSAIGAVIERGEEATSYLELKIPVGGEMSSRFSIHEVFVTKGSIASGDIRYTSDNEYYSYYTMQDSTEVYEFSSSGFGLANLPKSMGVHSGKLHAVYPFTVSSLIPNTDVRDVRVPNDLGVGTMTSRMSALSFIDVTTLGEDFNFLVNINQYMDGDTIVGLTSHYLVYTNLLNYMDNYVTTVEAEERIQNANLVSAGTLVNNYVQTATALNWQKRRVGISTHSSATTIIDDGNNNASTTTTLSVLANAIKNMLVDTSLPVFRVSMKTVRSIVNSIKYPTTYAWTGFPYPNPITVVDDTSNVIPSNMLYLEDSTDYLTCSVVSTYTAFNKTMVSLEITGSTNRYRNPTRLVVMDGYIQTPTLVVQLDLTTTTTSTDIGVGYSSVTFVHDGYLLSNPSSPFTVETFKNEVTSTMKSLIVDRFTEPDLLFSGSIAVPGSGVGSVILPKGDRSYNYFDVYVRSSAGIDIINIPVTELDYTSSISYKPSILNLADSSPHNLNLYKFGFSISLGTNDYTFRFNKRDYWGTATGNFGTELATMYVIRIEGIHSPSENWIEYQNPKVIINNAGSFS